jgi:hypothetical protein
VGLTAQKEKRYGKVDAYHKLEKLGEGTYATVYRGLSTYANIVPCSVAFKESQPFARSYIEQVAS